MENKTGKGFGMFFLATTIMLLLGLLWSVGYVDYWKEEAQERAKYDHLLRVWKDCRNETTFDCAAILVVKTNRLEFEDGIIQIAGYDEEGYVLLDSCEESLAKCLEEDKRNHTTWESTNTSQTARE